MIVLRVSKAVPCGAWFGIISAGNKGRDYWSGMVFQ
jgi:hypothetical protein